MEQNNKRVMDELMMDKERCDTKLHMHPSVFFRRYEACTVVYLTAEQKVFTFNSVAGDILECFKDSSTVSQVIDRLKNLYVVEDIDSFKHKISDFVCQLQNKKILVEDYQQTRVLNNLEKEVSSYFESGELYSVMFELTYNCNERCRHCYIVNEHREELSAVTIKQILDDLSEMNVFSIVFTGGELFTRKDAFEILEYAYSKHFVIDIFTNGNLLDGNDYIRLKSVWPRCVHFSLYSHIPEKHDTITQISGSYEKTLKSIKSCKMIGIPVNIKTPLFEETIDDVNGIVDLANSLACSVELGRNITPKKNGDLEPLNMKIHSESDEARVADIIGGLVKTLDNAPEQNPYRDKLCGAGERTVSIDPYGRVYPCGMLPICIGNVNEQSIKSIWKHSEKLKAWREINHRSLKKGCDGCEHSEECIFCPGEAMMRTGNPLCKYSEACDITALAVKNK